MSEFRIVITDIANLIIHKPPVIKKINCLSFLLLLCSSIGLFAQPDTFCRYFPNRYKLDIPEEWKKPKMIKALNEILPQTFDDYIDSNKQFCLDCKADFTVMLVIGNPYFNHNGQTFQFRAALGLFDTTGKKLMELLLVSQEEKHVIKLRAEYNNNQYPLDDRQNVYTEVIRDTNIGIINVVQTPVKPLPRGNSGPVYKKEITSTYDLMNIAESRVYQIKHVLSNLKKTAAGD